MFTTRCKPIHYCAFGAPLTGHFRMMMHALPRAIAYSTIHRTLQSMFMQRTLPPQSRDPLGTSNARKNRETGSRLNRDHFRIAHNPTGMSAAMA